MATPANVFCPNPHCKKPLISFKAGDKEGVSSMVVEPDALPHKSGILCKACGKDFLLDLNQ